MTVFPFEGINQADVRQDGFTVHREVLDNGIRIVTIENLSPGDREGAAEEAGVLKEIEKPLTMQLCMEELQNSLAAADGELSEEVKAAVAQMGQYLQAQIRGVCTTDGSPQELLGDGIIYISVPALCSKEAECIQKEANWIFRQLKYYSE